MDPLFCLIQIILGGGLLLSNKDSDWQKIDTDSMLLGKPNVEDNNSQGSKLQRHWVV